MFNADPESRWPGRMGFFAGWYDKPRAQRDSMTPIILHVLQDKPMHGYEIIKTLEELSHGCWKPSAGSIYPTLQSMEDQELLKSQEQDGKKIYSLTQKGTDEYQKYAHFAKPWEQKQEAINHFRDTGKHVHAIMNSIRHIAVHGSKEERKKAQEILAQTADKLSTLSDTISPK